MEDQKSEYNLDDWKFKLLKAEEQYDAQCQELFLLERKVKEYELIDHELSSELEYLASGKDSQCQQLEEELHRIEEENSKLDENYKTEHTKHTDIIYSITEQINRLEKDNKLLEARLVNVDDVNATEESYIEDKTKLLAFIQEELEIMEEQHTAERNTNQKLMRQIKEAEEEYECIQDRLKYCSEKQEASKISVAELQAVVALIETDINSRKTPALSESSRGNSMFAQVYDRSVQLEGQLAFIKSHYSVMQSQHADLLHQIKTYTADNFRLTNELDSQIQFMRKMHKTTVDNYLTDITREKAIYLEKKKTFESEVKFQHRDLPPGNPESLLRSYKEVEDRVLFLLDDMITSREHIVDASKKLAEAHNRVRDIQNEHTKLLRMFDVMQSQVKLVCKERNVALECNCPKIVVSSKARLFAFAKRN